MRTCTQLHILNAHFYLFYPIVNHPPGKRDPANPAPGNRNHPGNRKHPGNHNKMVPGNLNHPGNPDPRNVVIVVIWGADWFLYLRQQTRWLKTSPHPTVGYMGFI